MLQQYTFWNEGTITFNDENSVGALIAYAFGQFGYYEPFGMEIVTVFQGHHPDTNSGWITTDTTKTCAEEIKNPHELFFAYYLPNVFYFAEGGWGHHMKSLGNHPHIENATSLHIRFDDFDNTIVINGQYTFADIVNMLKTTEYIDNSCCKIKIIPVGCASGYDIPFSDPIMNVCLSDFEKSLEQYNAERITLSRGEYIYHTILQIC